MTTYSPRSTRSPRLYLVPLELDRQSLGSAIFVEDIRLEDGIISSTPDPDGSAGGRG